MSVNHGVNWKKLDLGTRVIQAGVCVFQGEGKNVAKRQQEKERPMHHMYLSTYGNGTVKLTVFVCVCVCVCVYVFVCVWGCLYV